MKDIKQAATRSFLNSVSLRNCLISSEARSDDEAVYETNIRRGGATKPQPKLGNCSRTRGLETTSTYLWEILIATFNPGKVREYKKLLKVFGFKIVSLKDVGIGEKFEEKGKTFEKNAKYKAEFYSKLTGLPALADDGGLEIDILSGKPGVKSRRWPGHEASDKELINFTLKKLEGVPFKKRKAQLRAVLAFKIPGRKVLIFEGKKKGFITKNPYGKLIRGYPFRSIFYLPEVGKTYNQFSFKEEKKLAHRAKAVKKLIAYLKKKKLV